LSDKHIFYILQRVERSFENIIKMIDKLDNYCLEKKEKVNYKTIRAVFESLSLR
jgi:chromosomal replication initiation ATPase DnaA